MPIDASGEEGKQARAGWPPADLPIAHADHDRRLGPSRHSLIDPHDDAHAHVADRQEHAPLLFRERCVVEDRFAGSRDLPCLATRHDRHLPHDCRPLRKDVWRRQCDPAIAFELAIDDAKRPGTDCGDPLHRLRAVRQDGDPSLVDRGRPEAVSPGQGAGRDPVARHEAGRHRKPDDLASDRERKRDQGRDDDGGQQPPHARAPTDRCRPARATHLQRLHPPGDRHPTIQERASGPSPQ